MEAAVGGEQRRDAQIDHLAGGIFARCSGQVRIQPTDGMAKTFDQEHLLVALAFRAVTVWSQVRAVQVGVADIGQPAEHFLFELVFGHSLFAKG